MDGSFSRLRRGSVVVGHTGSEFGNLGVVGCRTGCDFGNLGAVVAAGGSGADQPLYEILRELGFAGFG